VNWAKFIKEYFHPFGHFAPMGWSPWSALKVHVWEMQLCNILQMIDCCVIEGAALLQDDLTILLFQQNVHLTAAALSAMCSIDFFIIFFITQ
jgi:hypothetical protein